MVNDSVTDHLVRWNDEDEDSGFMILDPSEFEKQVLPQYFKKTNMDSFIRQLNIYEFHKKNRRQKVCKVFYNENFKRDNRELLINIKRNAPSKNNQKDSAQNQPKERLKKKFVENDLSTRTTETHNSAT